MEPEMISTEAANDVPAKPRTRGLRASLIVLGVVLVGLAWFIHSLADTLNRIVPGYGGRITSSMEPHDVVFRLLPRKREGRDNPTEPWEWHLRPPSAFVTRELGKNGIVQRSSIKGDGYWVDIQAIVSPDNKTLTPTAGQPPEKQVVRSIVMQLSNASALYSVRSVSGSCVPQHLKGTILGARGDKVWRDEPCHDQDLRCRISMDADGWRVDLSATKDLYADPENVCRLVRNFLDSHTVRRDRIP